MQIDPGLLKAAQAVLDLKYTAMTEMADLLIASVKSREENNEPFDPTSQAEWCDLLRWWAEGYVDAAGDQKAA